MPDGNTSPKPRRQRNAPTSDDPVEIAMEAQASGRAPNDEATLLLADQRRLIQADLVHRRWQIMSERIGGFFRLLTCVAGLVVVVFAGALIWQAAHADGIVVEPFATPPSMAEKGLTGAVVAGQVLDRLKAMETDTSSMRAIASYGGGWGEGIRLSIPNTGISIGDVQSYLTGWLGHETKVGGNVFQTADGQLAVATRVGGAAGTTVTGPAGDLDALIGKSAEAVFAATQPYLYSRWLTDHGRAPEAVPILQRLLYSADKTERLWALLSMASPAIGATTEVDQRRYLEAALRVDPQFMPAVITLASLEMHSGNDERTVQLRRRLAANADLFRRQAAPDLAEEDLAINDAQFGVLTGDYARGIAATWKVLSVYSTNTQRGQTVMRGVQHALNLHDLVLARRIRDEGGLSDAALAPLEATLQTGGSLAARERLALEDWSAAADGLAPVWADPRAFPLERAVYPIALARAGRVAEAEQAIAAVPGMNWPPGIADKFDLLTARAVVADAAGRHAEADGLFRRAIALGPSLPRAHEAWSHALLVRGDAAGALREAKLAVQTVPRRPDAHRAEGQALHALRRDGDAAAAYAEAAKTSPNWGGLDIDWGVALAGQGKAADAQAKWRTAAALDLSPADRARVQALLAGKIA
jgi:Tfp pilus assembly protein PilF